MILVSSFGFSFSCFFRSGEGAEDSHRGGVEGCVEAAEVAVGDLFFGCALDRLDHLGFGPAAALAMMIWIQSSSEEGFVVTTEISQGGGVEAGIVFLQSAAAERFAILSAGSNFKHDGVAIPGAIAGDFVGVETGGVKGAIPFAEQPLLQTSERGAGKFIAPASDGSPMQVVASALGLFDENDDALLGPARSPGDVSVIDAGFFECFAVGAEMIRRRGKERLIAFGDL